MTTKIIRKQKRQITIIIYILDCIQIRKIEKNREKQKQKQKQFRIKELEKILLLLHYRLFDDDYFITMIENFVSDISSFLLDLKHLVIK